MATTSKNLLIISDSTMCYKDGIPYAFGPVVMEVRYFLEYFESITWIGGAANMNPTFYELPPDRVRLKILPRIKAKGWMHKFGVLFHYPLMLQMLKEEIRKHEFIHVRAPSHPALGAMLLAKRYPMKRFWFKYAGSWVDPASRMYDLQRRRLRNMPSHCVVTVNGKWPESAENILAFENPCLTPKHREEGARVLNDKNREVSKERDFCFVGRLNANKGIIPLVRAWGQMEKPGLGTLHIVGEGPLKQEVEQWASKSKNKVVLHSLMTKEAVHQLYASCYAVVLPTRTEGFPKVIGEAMNYGCLPVVTDVSCIGQYIQTGANGVLLEAISEAAIEKGLHSCLQFDAESVERMRKVNYELAEKFTYGYFMKRLEREVFPINLVNQNPI